MAEKCPLECCVCGALLVFSGIRRLSVAVASNSQLEPLAGRIQLQLSGQTYSEEQMKQNSASTGSEGLELRL